MYNIDLYSKMNNFLNKKILQFQKEKIIKNIYYVCDKHDQIFLFFIIDYPINPSQKFIFLVYICNFVIPSELI